MNKKLLFIYNPRSGKQTVKRKLSDIVDVFTKGGYDVTCHPTQAVGDCMQTVSEMMPMHDLTVVSGGDGTLNEAVNGYMAVENKTALGYIPFGSTNDFSHSVGIPQQPEKAAQIAITGEEFECDLGCLNGRYFTYVAAFGSLAEVSYSTPQDTKNALGFGAYLLEGLATIPVMKSFDIKFETKERSGEGNYLIGLITNSSHVAGAKNTIVEGISLDDGLFEVILVKKPQNVADINKIITHLLKRELDNEYIDCFKTSAITITSDQPLSWTLDGENGGSHQKSEIINFPKALKIMRKGENNA
ncbi:MAG: YegS/Rv2252/BmrU family lipid kinase [Oscillospiraceae bacterium]|nr:YegS/Rv2252/BmrU family lipid kinase [Oscillospiraceae bacterium]